MESVYDVGFPRVNRELIQTLRGQDSKQSEFYWVADWWPLL